MPAWRSSITANASIDADVPRRTALPTECRLCATRGGSVKDMYRTGVAPTVILLFCNAMQFKWLASSWKFVPRAN